METVVLKIPNYSWGDCQESAEYIAYSINYISEISNGKNVSVMAWSQGTVDTQWVSSRFGDDFGDEYAHLQYMIGADRDIQALKYWPSTRKVVNDFIALSPDFKGSTVGRNWADYFRWQPAIYQQDAKSKFISTLRADSGDSAFVPTTTIYSSDDEFVMPQDWDNASGSLKDERKVGASNVLVQAVCNNQPAGLLISHADMLTNSLAIDLTVDALSNPGPANISRIDRKIACAQEVAPGMEEDAFNVGHFIWSLCNVFGSSMKEPPIKAYAS